MAEKPKLYLETTIPSYLVARPSRDVIVLARQQLTRDWWDNRRHDYEIYVSQIVLEESSRGDATYARKRLELLQDLPVLDVTPPAIKELADRLLKTFSLPAKALTDALHLAVASYHVTDYLLTWNCAHLANAHVVRRLTKYAADNRCHLPTVCTPEELVNERSSL